MLLILINVNVFLYVLFNIYIFIFYLIFVILIIIMGIGDWAQSPIPNPHLRLLKYLKIVLNYFLFKSNKKNGLFRASFVQNITLRRFNRR